MTCCSGVVEPWRVENCQKALADYGSYVGGGTLFWLTSSATPDLCFQDAAYSFKELEDMSNKLQLCLVSVSVASEIGSLGKAVGGCAASKAQATVFSRHGPDLRQDNAEPVPQNPISIGEHSCDRGLVGGCAFKLNFSAVASPPA